jgi:hypothetical protein
MKQTVIEWLEDTLYPYLNKEDKEYTHSLFNKAKEMEKEQRIKAYQLGYDTGYKVCEMKFNGLFKSE